MGSDANTQAHVRLLGDGGTRRDLGVHSEHTLVRIVPQKHLRWESVRGVDGRGGTGNQSTRPRELEQDSVRRAVPLLSPQGHIFLLAQRVAKRVRCILVWMTRVNAPEWGLQHPS